LAIIIDEEQKITTRKPSYGGYSFTYMEMSIMVDGKVQMVPNKYTEPLAVWVNARAKLEGWEVNTVANEYLEKMCTERMESTTPSLYGPVVIFEENDNDPNWSYEGIHKQYFNRDLNGIQIKPEDKIHNLMVPLYRVTFKWNGQKYRKINQFSNWVMRSRFGVFYYIWHYMKLRHKRWEWYGDDFEDIKNSNYASWHPTTKIKNAEDDYEKFLKNEIKARFKLFFEMEKPELRQNDKSWKYREENL